MPKNFINITTDISDLQRLLQILARAEKHEIPKEVKDSTKRMERFAKKILRTGTRTGIHYRGKRFRSSAPGEAPRSQTGYLARSIGSKYRKRGATAQGIVGATAPHALWLEHGLRSRRTVLKARPFLKPTIEKEIPILVRNLTKILQ